MAFGQTFDGQPNCNVEGINDAQVNSGGCAQYPGGYCSRARLGILFNNENDCLTPDTAEGFGLYTYSNVGASCGSSASALFGYILGA